MKSVFYALLMAASFIACQDDDEKTDASIVGEWQGDRLEAKATTGIVTLYEETDDEFDGTLSFGTDGTVVYTRDNVESPGTYTISDGKLTTDADFDLYNISGPVTFDIVVLTETRLQLKIKQTQQVLVPDIGEVPVDITATLDFNRL